MSSIRHHLDDATLVSYAAGSLSNAMALVVACHLSQCEHCKQRNNQLEQLGGALLENTAPVEMSSSALQDMLDMLDQKPSIRVTESVQAVQQARDIPKPLWPYLDKPIDDLEWKRLAPGISYIDLNCQSSGASKLLRIAPGKSVLPHTHSGNELTMVLRGSFSDEVGRFAAGDIADIDNAIEHQPLVDSHEDCICLIATDGPLRFTTLFGRVIQPLTGF